MSTNTIQITVNGNIGSGKSHILATIEKALKNEYGNDVMIASRDLFIERNMCRDEDMEKINKSNTVIVLREEN